MLLQTADDDARLRYNGHRRFKIALMVTTDSSCECRVGVLVKLLHSNKTMEVVINSFKGNCMVLT